MILSSVIKRSSNFLNALLTAFLWIQLNVKSDGRQVHVLLAVRKTAVHQMWSTGSCLSCGNSAVRKTAVHHMRSILYIQASIMPLEVQIKSEKKEQKKTQKRQKKCCRKCARDCIVKKWTLLYIQAVKRKNLKKVLVRIWTLSENKLFRYTKNVIF